MVNYALLYGKSAFTLAKDLGIERKQAEAFIAAYFSRYPAVRRFIDQTIEQAYQRDRLQLEHLGQIDLGQALLLPQTEQHNPLRAGGAPALGAVIDIVAQQARAFDKLRNELAFQVERHKASSLPKLSNCLGFFKL
jgi:DNA polymerase-1